jgi:hypothetical protein
MLRKHTALLTLETSGRKTVSLSAHPINLPNWSIREAQDRLSEILNRHTPKAHKLSGLKTLVSWFRSLSGILAPLPLFH